MQIKPRGTKIIVTGGSSGIGFAIAKRLLKDNISVMLVGRDEEKLQNAKAQLDSDKCFYFPFDVTCVSKINDLLQNAELQMEGADTIVNSAGIATRFITTAGAEDPVSWDKIFETNLKSVVFLTRTFCEYFKRNNISGNVLNISSSQAFAHKKVSAYQIAKMAVTEITRGIAKNYAPFGIVVNGIAPGVVVSGMTPRPKDNICKNHATGKIIEPEQIADIACFLLSEQGKIIIGDTIKADSGFIGAN
jgi:3-oxoacyl-[acyl-carrier protein] reductase